MTPAPLKREDVVLIVRETVEELFAKRESRINDRLSKIEATQSANHEENRRRLDSTDHKLDDVLQLGENQVAMQKGRDLAHQEFEDAQLLLEDIRQKTVEKWMKRIAWLLSLNPLTVYQGIIFIHRLFLWHSTGHFFQH